MNMLICSPLNSCSCFLLFTFSNHNGTEGNVDNSQQLENDLAEANGKVFQLESDRDVLFGELLDAHAHILHSNSQIDSFQVELETVETSLTEKVCSNCIYFNA